MVAQVRRGQSLRAVARQYGVTLATVQRWATRAAGRRLDRVDWTDRSSRPHTVHRTGPDLEDTVLELRAYLKHHTALGEYGAVRIQQALRTLPAARAVSVRTIGRILQRRGALDGLRRVRRPAPPRGWYLPTVAAGAAEVDSFDFVEGLVIRGGLEVEVLTGVGLHSGWPMAWPAHPFTAAMVLECLVAYWQQWGLPHFAQFDNDTRFQGAHHHPDVISRVMRLCLSLRIVPVFAPPREPGFQNAIENFNGRWQTQVWRRFEHRSYTGLAQRSDAYVTALRARLAARWDAAPARSVFPREWQLDLQRHPQGQLIFLRRTNDTGTLSVLGHRFVPDRAWAHRLVRCEVDLDQHRVRFYQLRRRQPDHQPLLNELAYDLPRRAFRE